MGVAVHAPLPPPLFRIARLLSRGFVDGSSVFRSSLVSSREKAQIMKKSGMKRVLLLGSGYVSGPVVEYLTRDDKTQVTVGE